MFTNDKGALSRRCLPDYDFKASRGCLWPVQRRYEAASARTKGDICRGLGIPVDVVMGVTETQ